MLLAISVPALALAAMLLVLARARREMPAA
jgi:hypothetical protein